MRTQCGSSHINLWAHPRSQASPAGGQAPAQARQPPCSPRTDWTQALKQPCWHKAQSSPGIWSTPCKERSQRGETRTWPSHGPVQGQGPHPRWHPQAQAPEGGQENLTEGSQYSVQRPGSEGSTGLGEGLVSEPGNLSLVFLANKAHGAYLRLQSGRLCRLPSPPSTLREGIPPRTLVRVAGGGGVARALPGP